MTRQLNLEKNRAWNWQKPSELKIADAAKKWNIFLCCAHFLLTEMYKQTYYFGSFDTTYVIS
jgi:hypothetical protein